jgi:hypothetical protein
MGARARDGTGLLTLAPGRCKVQGAFARCEDKVPFGACLCCSQHGDQHGGFAGARGEPAPASCVNRGGPQE